MQTTLWSKCIQIEKFGEPNEVSILCTIPIDPKKWNENAALIRWIASPINLLDLNIIKGKYKKINTNLNKFPCIGGTEGVGLVERVGSNVQHLSVGDLVININYWLNNNQNEIELNQIWTEWDIIPSNSLFSIDKKINFVSAATLGISPPIAWTLINDFVKLEKGDWIIQNAANSDIGITIIQLAKDFGYFTLNLIEDKQDSTSLRNELYSLGATKIFNEKEFCNEITTNKQFKEQFKIRLALNNGDKNILNLISKGLGDDGVLVIYGKKTLKFTRDIVYYVYKIFGVVFGAIRLEDTRLPIAK
ncbi:unnamed protein product [Meloidogyne enterolobii]|uniref:Uncharacterized protein n=1 Tax=Meloidogyne enterolobii TaxID=390850 RepID=A0ACB1APT0_MELEN